MGAESREGVNEKIVGEIPVVARLAFGSERLRLFLTDRRMILAHVGKRGAAAVTVTSFFGWLSGAVEDIFKRSRESVSQRGIETRSPDRIMALDKDNFDVKYTEVVSAEIVLEEFSTLIILLTGKDKLELRTGFSPEKVASLMKPLIGDKLSIREPRRASRVERG